MDLFTVINVDGSVGSLCVYWSVGGQEGLTEGWYYDIMHQSTKGLSIQTEHCRINAAIQ